MEKDIFNKLTRTQCLEVFKNTKEEDYEEMRNIIRPFVMLKRAGRGIPDGLYETFKSESGSKFLNKIGFYQCQATAFWYELKEGDLYYFDVNEMFSGKEKRAFLSRGARANITYDEILKEKFLEKSVAVLDTDFTTKTVASSHARFKIDQGEWFSSQVARRNNICSTFKTNFYGYGRGPRDWAIPEGDTIGVEIEMLFPSLERKIQFSSWVGQNFTGWICEYDGSLEDHGEAGERGLELISPPLLIENMQDQVTKICEKAIELGGMGFQAGVFYGMHVTQSIPKSVRNGPTKSMIASRYIALLNEPALRPFWQLVARRKGESFSMYSPFKDIDIETCLITERGENERYAHRRSVFVRNNNLLETRIFRSNLSPIQVRSNIEICSIAMQFCKSPEFSLTNLRFFYDFLQKNMSKDLRACLYRKKNTPIRVLNEVVINSEISAEPDLVSLNS